MVCGQRRVVSRGLGGSDRWVRVCVGVQRRGSDIRRCAVESVGREASARRCTVLAVELHAGCGQSRAHHWTVAERRLRTQACQGLRRRQQVTTTTTTCSSCSCSSSSSGSGSGSSNSSSSSTYLLILVVLVIGNATLFCISFCSRRKSAHASGLLHFVALLYFLFFRMTRRFTDVLVLVG